MQIPHCTQQGEEDGERSHQNPEIKKEALRGAVTVPPAEQGSGVRPQGGRSGPAPSADPGLEGLVAVLHGGCQEKRHLSRSSP